MCKLSRSRRRNYKFNAFQALFFCVAKSWEKKFIKTIEIAGKKPLTSLLSTNVYHMKRETLIKSQLLTEGENTFQLSLLRWKRVAASLFPQANEMKALMQTTIQEIIDLFIIFSVNRWISFNCKT